MKLVDETEFKKLLSNLKIEETISWRISCKFYCWTFTIENKVSFIGKVNDDDLGNKYEESLKMKK